MSVLRATAQAHLVLPALPTAFLRSTLISRQRRTRGSTPRLCACPTTFVLVLILISV